jgi:integrase
LVREPPAGHGFCGVSMSLTGGRAGCPARKSCRSRTKVVPRGWIIPPVRKEYRVIRFGFSVERVPRPIIAAVAAKDARQYREVLIYEDAQMLLADLLDVYLSEREASPRYIESLNRTVRRARECGLLDTSQLLPEKANEFLSRLPLAAVTRANIRRELLTLWRFAFEHSYTDVPPLRVCRIKATPPPPRAWSLDTLRKLLAAAEQDARPVSQRCPGLLWRDVLPCWIVVGYDTGLRFSDLLHLHGENIVNGCVICTAQKTGKFTVRAISPAGRECVGRLLEKSRDGTLFRWALSRRRVLRKWKDFLDEQGIVGSSRWLRRSGATYVESQRHGEAQQFLGHSNPTLAVRHYLDQTLTMRIPASPPPLR